MKTTRFFLYLAINTATFLLLSCGTIGGPPTSLQITAATDSTVQLVWTTPAEGIPDRFHIYFCPVGETLFQIVGDTTANTYIHNPQGITGSYRIAAVFGSKEYISPTVLTTIPVHTPAKIVYELDGIGNAGYGWARDSGTARTYSMRQTGNASMVDFYITDFTTGTSSPYRIASPDMGPSDPSGVVPLDTNWRRTGFTNPLADENAPLPAVDSTIYFIYTTIPSAPLPVQIGCYSTAGGHYALVKVRQVNTANATVELESWFQLVPELRLIRH